MKNKVVWLFALCMVLFSCTFAPKTKSGQKIPYNDFIGSNEMKFNVANTVINIIGNQNSIFDDIPNILQTYICRTTLGINVKSDEKGDNVFSDAFVAAIFGTKKPYFTQDELTNEIVEKIAKCVSIYEIRDKEDFNTWCQIILMYEIDINALLQVLGEEVPKEQQYVYIMANIRFDTRDYTRHEVSFAQEVMNSPFEIF